MSGYTGMKRMPHAPRRHSECRSFIAAAVVQLPAVNQSLTADGDPSFRRLTLPPSASPCRDTCAASVTASEVLLD